MDVLRSLANEADGTLRYAAGEKLLDARSVLQCDEGAADRDQDLVGMVEASPHAIAARIGQLDLGAIGTWRAVRGTGLASPVAPAASGHHGCGRAQQREPRRR